MSSPQRQNQEETVVPWGVVFIAIGVLILLTVGAVVFLSYSQRPGETPAFTLLPTREYASIVITTRNAQLELAPTPSTNNTVPILLPESPNSNTLFPSEASVNDAPQVIYYEPKPGQPIRLVIPDLSLDAPIQPVSLQTLELDGQLLYQWEVPAGYQAGWHGSSALLGEPGNTVINGHNNTLGEIFRDLADLEAGDSFSLFDIEKEYRYRIERIEILPEQGQSTALRLENAKWIDPTSDERVTLVSCWPYIGNTHRIVVVARPE